MTSSKWFQELAAIGLLLAAVALVLARLPRAEVGHSPAFRRRRFLNWFPVGLTYAFLYMGRYNLNAFTNAAGQGLTTKQFAGVFAAGTAVYGFSFLLNGPLADRYGGRVTILIAAVGAAAMNAAMGVAVAARATSVILFAVLYAGNMYFQSFGAVSIVKVNAPWFHLRERGSFGAIFGILISLGVYFAFDWGRLIAEHMPLACVFLVPAGLLLLCAGGCFVMVRDSPADAGLSDFDTADASSGDDGPPLGVRAVALRMVRDPVIVVISLVELCSGYLRQAVMQWYPIFARQTGFAKDFVPSHWGMLTCVAGILGGVVAGALSDAFFQSRRGPMSAVLYGGMVVGALGMMSALGSPALGAIAVFMSLCVIGVHGMLSGTASMDFGGRRNVGVAVGIIDGCVYLGSTLQGLVYKRVLPEGDAAKDPASWSMWPLAMLPVATIGLVLATRVWSARPVARVKAATGQ